MAEFNVRSDSVNVEHIMEQIRARIREKRGVDYTEAQIQELATARLSTFIDPNKLQSNLLKEFHRVRAEGDAPEAMADVIDDSVLFETHRPWLRALRKLLRPILRLFLNTKALAALSAQSKTELSRKSRDQMTFEVIHNMVVEMTRLGIEVKNLTMRVESMQSRLEFNERRARALEGAVVYKPSDPQPAEHIARPPTHDVRPPPEYRPRQEDYRPRQEAPASAASSPAPMGGGAPASGTPDGQGQRSRRRRRRRGRRGGGLGASPTGPQPSGQSAPSGDSAAPQHEASPDESFSSGPDTDDSGPDTDTDPQ